MAIEIQILSKELIKPSAPTPTQHETHDLTFFDQLSLQTHVRFIFFYSSNPTCINLENLQKSLSKTLNLYPPFAGRFEENGLAVSCRSQGVAYLRVQVSDQLTEFLHKANNDPKLFDDLVPQDLGEAKSVNTPILGVQETSFGCGGLALGISNSHALADGHSWGTFLFQWSVVNRLGLGGSQEALILPDFNLPHLFPANMLPIKAPQPAKTTTVKVNKAFVFSAEEISSLKASCSGVNNGRVSRVTVVTATIWKALIHTCSVKNGCLRPSVMSLTFSLRGRNGLIPNNSFGNVLARVPIRFSPNNENQVVELHHLVSLIVDGIESTVEAFSKASTTEEIASLVLSRHNEVSELKMNEQVDFFTLASLCNFPFLDVDFGWGKPSSVYKFMELVVVNLMDTNCRSGIEARVQLNQMDMTEFEHHPSIKPLISPSH